MMNKPANKVRGRIRLAFEDCPDTPVMVYGLRSLGTPSATFECACCTGELDDLQLTQDELDWLELHRRQADDWYDHRRELE